MNYGALKDEYAARGFDYHSDTRRGQYINWGRAELDAAYLWPYRRSSATGTASAGTVTATDLGTAYLVQDTANSFMPLRPASEIALLERWGDLTLTGTPYAYYVTKTGTTGTVSAYPVGGTIKVFYYAVTPDLASPTDTPASPSQYHGLIVDRAVQMAYRDSDDHSAAERLQAWIDQQTQRMVEDVFATQVQAGVSMRMRYAEWDS